MNAKSLESFAEILIGRDGPQSRDQSGWVDWREPFFWGVNQINQIKGFPRRIRVTILVTQISTRLQHPPPPVPTGLHNRFGFFSTDIKRVSTDKNKEKDNEMQLIAYSFYFIANLDPQ